MTREEAITALRMCPACRRWITTPECDHCWVDNHRCPPCPPMPTGGATETVNYNETAYLRAYLRVIGREP